MTLTTDMGHDGMELFNLLLRNTEESTRLSDRPFNLTVNDALSPQRYEFSDDFLEALLHDSSSSGPASPTWSPCNTDSQPSDSPHPITCTALPVVHTHTFPQPPSLDEMMLDVSVDLGWESSGCHDESGFTNYLSENQNLLLPSSHSLTVKDLLLSNIQTAQRAPKHSLQELVLNEDEKKLLAKEGVNLPCKLPLSKSEERVLKKIRRKIRNKRSAQESRKKKREYVDSLEGRMAACNAQNLKLQRKIQQLEDTNTALLEQLNQLQALLPNGSSKTTNRGTRVLVLLLSFSLLISSNLQPDPYSQRSQAEYSDTKASSRSLQSMDRVGDVPPPSLPFPSVSRGLEDLRSLKEKLWAWTDRLSFQDHRQEEDHPSSRNI